MWLNQTYYRALNEKYSTVQLLPNKIKDRVSILTLRLILSNRNKNEPLHFNFQNNRNAFNEVRDQLFIELANEIYLNHYDLPSSYEVGEKLKKIKDNQYYEVVRMYSNKYTLRQILRKNQNKKLPVVIRDISYDKLSRGYVKVESGIRESTIKNYFDFFKKLNHKEVEFPQVYFDQKAVFIAKKSFWDDLNVKSKIPTIYLPNPREEVDHHVTKSIPALSDCIMYVTPKYEVCYQDVLSKGKRINTIVICDTDMDSLEQVLQDRNKFHFNIILLTNSFTPEVNKSFNLWNWFKEEIEILDSIWLILIS